MSGKKDNSKQNTASLLLQPPNSGFSWDPIIGGSNILMPVSSLNTQTAVEDGAETDSFIGQKPQAFPPQSSVSANHPGIPSSNYSQLQQPLRPLQNKSPTPPPPTSQTIQSTFVQHPIRYSDASTMLAPPVGPAQNFRRQAPLSYVAAPGMGAPPITQSPHSFTDGAQESPSVQMQAFQPILSNEQYNTSSSQFAIPPPPTAADMLKPVLPHWFYKKEVEKREIWCPFTMIDSLNLEAAYKSKPRAIVTTDGGRYDIDLGERVRRSVYWTEDLMPVKRATWFYKLEGQNRFVPYDEELAEKIEAHYIEAVTYSRWQHKLELSGNEIIVVQSANVILHFLPSNQPDEWGNVLEGQMRPRVMKRGTAEVATIEPGETLKIDHVVFFVHGVGAVCDLKFRSVNECVDDFRSIALSLLQSHFKGPLAEGKIGRVEFLPVSWHSKLHSDATGIDCHLQTITLSSIPKLRHFTNDTLLDILFYTSPIYCKTIVDTVAFEANRMYELFLTRNPGFTGKVSVVGHSLGSLILFDILAHQCSPNRAEAPAEEVAAKDPIQCVVDTTEEDNSDNGEQTMEEVFRHLSIEDYLQKFEEEKIDLDTLKFCSESDIKEMGLPMGPRKKLIAYLKEQEAQQSKKVAAEQATPATATRETVTELQASHELLHRSESVASVSYRVGMAGTGQPSIVYPKMNFSPSCFFALGSPISMFLTVRGIQTIGEEFHLPTCPAFFNIFHPFDPVAYRMEMLIDPDINVKPVLIPHHKGRKRMHLELKDSLTRMGMDFKQKLMDSLRYTWNSISEFARAHRSSTAAVEEAMDLMVQEELSRAEGSADDTESTVSEAYSPEDIQVGRLNGGRRIDYVLQEKPIESFNEYLFALASHACYWESEDTALMILKEVYAIDGIFPQTPNVSKVQLYNPAVNRGPATAPPILTQGGMSEAQSNGLGALPYGLPNPPPSAPTQTLGPPPLSGFVRSSSGIKR